MQIEHLHSEPGPGTRTRTGNREEARTPSRTRIHTEAVIMDLVDPLAEPCAVCGDRSTGQHYGVISCNGCKGFFRRTILRNQKFTCRFNKRCVIDKNFRCACRYCRFQKCVAVGMKREAIQLERDAISGVGGSPIKRGRMSPSPNGGPSGGGGGGGAGVTGAGSSERSSVINGLMAMETRVTVEMSTRFLRSSVVKTNDDGSPSDVRSASTLADALNGAGVSSGEGGANSEGTSSAFTQPSRPCTVEELNDISRTTLLLMVEWAKNLAPFPDLSMEDKIILLKNYAPQHLILMPAFRSPDTTRVCLFNNTYMSRDQGAELNGFAAFKTSNITPRVLDEIVWPMRQLHMKEEEFVCLKALAFLHPEAKGLTTSSQLKVREARNKVLKALYAFIVENSPEEAPTRYGNILLLAPALKALTQLLIENMTLTKFFGLAEVDSLLSEFILDDFNDQTNTQAQLQAHLTTGNIDLTLSAAAAAAAVTSAPGGVTGPMDPTLMTLL